MIKCKKCGELKPESEYYTHKTNKTGHAGSCKECQRALARTRASRGKCGRHKRIGASRYNIKGPTVYQLLGDRDEIIYIGLSTDFYTRISRHRTRSGFWDEVTGLRYAQMGSQLDMAICEILLINKHEPKYNNEIFTGEPSSWFMAEPEWQWMPKPRPVDL